VVFQGDEKNFPVKGFKFLGYHEKAPKTGAADLIQRGAVYDKSSAIRFNEGEKFSY